MWRAISVCSLCVLAAISLSAASPARLGADVPFEFEAQGRIMPAGYYEFSPVGIAGPGSNGVMSITNQNGGRVLTFLFRENEGDLKPQMVLVFERQGHQMKLAGIRTRPAESVEKP